MADELKSANAWEVSTKWDNEGHHVRRPWGAGDVMEEMLASQKGFKFTGCKKFRNGQEVADFGQPSPLEILRLQEGECLVAYHIPESPKSHISCISVTTRATSWS